MLNKCKFYRRGSEQKFITKKRKEQSTKMKIHEYEYQIMPEDNQVVSDLDVGEPPADLLEWARININENPETRDQVVSDFRDLIYARGECTPHRTDDAYLLRFLRCRNFVIEKAHRLMVNYYEFKENNPQFININIPDLRNIGDTAIVSVPPYREQHGRRILLYRMGNWDPSSDITIDNIFQATLACLELAILEQRHQILGGIGIFDLGGLTLQQAWHMTPSIAQKMIQITVTSFPVKITAMHIVNQSWAFDIIYNVFKPFLNEGMKERIFFHGSDWESLHQHIDPKYLPERYGGVHPDYNYNDWFDNLEKNEYIQKEMQLLGYTNNKPSESDEKLNEVEENSEED